MQWEISWFSWESALFWLLVCQQSSALHSQVFQHLLLEWDIVIKWSFVPKIKINSCRPYFDLFFGSYLPLVTNFSFKESQISRAILLSVKAVIIICSPSLTTTSHKVLYLASFSLSKSCQQCAGSFSVFWLYAFCLSQVLTKKDSLIYFFHACFLKSCWMIDFSLDSPVLAQLCFILSTWTVESFWKLLFLYVHVTSSGFVTELWKLQVHGFSKQVSLLLEYLNGKSLLFRSPPSTCSGKKDHQILLQISWRWQFFWMLSLFCAERLDCPWDRSQ